MDPKRVARGARPGVPHGRHVGNQVLAGLFAMSAELGPLLSNSQRISGWLDSAPGGGHRFSLSWTLPPSEKPSP